MCFMFTLGRLDQLVNSSTSNSFPSARVEELTELCGMLALLVRLVAFIAITALIVVMLFVIMRCILDIEIERRLEQTRSSSEARPLLPGKAIPFTYGTCDKDLESAGNCSDSTSSSCSSSSSGELYDGKVCVICYDEERNCFFVPCGHCATCHVCAQRIFYEENKACPVCRRSIRRVRRLFAPTKRSNTIR